MILTADWHLTDTPDEEYRWKVFDTLIEVAQEYDENRVFILGDLTDKKDRHSAAMVNRLVVAFDKCIGEGLEFHIIMGNHDAPLKGMPYWQILNHMRLNFYSWPVALGNLLLLPYTPDPATAWDDIDFRRFKAAFIHQPLKGARSGGYIMDSGSSMPLLPRGLRVYAGDIHYPQTVGRVTYVGAPHRVRYGDDHECRMLILRDDYTIKQEVELIAPKKTVVSVSSIAELKALDLGRGDMVRVRYQLEPSSVETWPADQEAIEHWARDSGVVLGGIEGTLDQQAGQASAPRFDADPRAVIEAYGVREGLDEGLLEAGRWFVQHQP